MRRTFLYVDAIQKFEGEIKGLDLSEAYKKAKPSFTGKLERTFIVLKDLPGEETAMEIEPATGANAEPLKKDWGIQLKQLPQQMMDSIELQQCNFIYDAKFFSILFKEANKVKVI